MNGLSWIIYSGEIVGKLGGVGWALAVIFSIVGLGFLVMGLAILAYAGESDEQQTTGRKVKGYGKPLLILASLFLLIGIFTPSRQAIYLIGASQAGEQILALQEVQEVGGEAGALATDTIKLLRQMVSEQLEAGR